MDRDLGIISTSEIAVALQELLSKEVSLYLQAHLWHWNVKAANFSEMHEFFKKAYELFYNAYDAIAERLRHLNYMAEFPEIISPKKLFSPKEMLTSLGDDLETCLLFMSYMSKLMTEQSDAAGQTLISQQILEFQDMLWRIDSFKL